MDSDPDLALPDLGLAAAAEGFVAVAGGDDRLPRVRFEGASRVEAISAACREAASEASAQPPHNIRQFSVWRSDDS